MAKKLMGIKNWSQLANAAQYQVGILANQCGVSSKTLERHIKLFHGKCPRQWLHELLMLRAVELLPECDSIKAVAAELGYTQPQNFCRDFKKHTGHAPGDFRKQFISGRVCDWVPEN